jgi:hypothetical protein
MLFSKNVKTITGKGTLDELKAKYEGHRLDQREFNLSAPLRQPGAKAQFVIRTYLGHYTRLRCLEAARRGARAQFFGCQVSPLHFTN